MWRVGEVGKKKRDGEPVKMMAAVQQLQMSSRLANCTLKINKCKWNRATIVCFFSFTLSGDQINYAEPDV